MKVALLVWLTVVASAAPAVAQEQQLVPVAEFEHKLDELAKWLKEYEAWERWFEVWGNRVARNFDDQPLWQRQMRPEPPAWLDAECQHDWVDDGGLFANACYIVRHWNEQPILILQRRGSSLVTSAGKSDDKIVKRSFFQRVHLTGLWMEARYPATPAYGIVGLQMGVFEAGRITLPAAGLMVVMLPDGDGGHAWKAATTLGFAYRICDFVAPVVARQASLHINVARVNVHGVQDEGVLSGSAVHLFGLSVSTKRR